MLDNTTLAYFLVAVFTLYLARSILWSQTWKLRKIPTVGGPSTPILSWLGVYNMVKRGTYILDEAYNEYKGGAYKFSEAYGWHVLVSGSSLVEELLKAPEDVLSKFQCVRELLHYKYTMGPYVYGNVWHIHVVRSQFTRSLEKIYPDIHDEIVATFNDLVRLRGDEWTAVTVMPASVHIINRTTNRAFVGLPKCRDIDYLGLTHDVAKNVVNCAKGLALFPTVLQPIAGYFMSNFNASLNRAVKHIGPIINERLRMQDKYGNDWPDKPVDFLQFLLESENAVGEERSVHALMSRMLHLNFAAIHTSAAVFTQALYRLAANPEYIQPLREEIDAVIRKEGWTKSALQQMRKVDSFLRESQRTSVVSSLLGVRHAVKDYTFSDGTFIPAGTTISIPVRAIHYDETIYPNADRFDPWRFVDMGEDEGKKAQQQFVNTSIDYVPFGHAYHACPGRFFAATELKTMFAHIVSTYDVKMENEGVFPPSLRHKLSYMPDPKAKVMFRGRQT